MCQLSAQPSSCQDKFYCSGSPCLPHWKFDDGLTTAQGTGSATDGDEDAMLGMILFVKALESNKPAFWSEVDTWAQDTCQAFFAFDTIRSNAGTARAPRLGSCWGGWDCNNPSYWSPAAYRACSNFLQQRGGPRLDWNTLLDTTYQLAAASQCPSTGLVPNWYVPNAHNPSQTGTTACSGSGTPAGQFGAEAARLVWRMAADYVIYGTAQSRAFSLKVILSFRTLSLLLFLVVVSDLLTICVSKAVASVMTADKGNGAWGPLQTVLPSILFQTFVLTSTKTPKGLSGDQHLRRLVEQCVHLRASLLCVGRPVW